MIKGLIAYKTIKSTKKFYISGASKITNDHIETSNILNKEGTF